MLTTIVIPIIYLNKYSHRTIKKIVELQLYENLKFLFIVNDKVVEQIKQLTDNMVNNRYIHVVNSTSSNKLRSLAQIADSEYIYYHDCDDIADYKFINEFTKTLKEDTTVHVFNVTKIYLDDLENNYKQEDIYNAEEGIINNIQNLSQNVYSKFIPTKLIKNIDFPNIPFTQDWAISYSLFLLAPHKFYKRSTYTYFFYPTSSSKPCHDDKLRLTKVKAYSRQIINRYQNLGKKFDADYLTMIYDIVLSSRFNRIGIKYRLKFPPLKTFYNLNSRKKLSIIFQYYKFLLRQFSILFK